MADDRRPLDRFDELAGLYLEGAATDKDAAELADLARGNPELRRALGRLFMQHGTLAWILRGGPQQRSGAEPPFRASRLRGAGVAIALAASLLITVIIIRTAPGGGTGQVDRTTAQTGDRTLSFQDGVSPRASYAGTRDSRLLDKDPSENRGADPILEVEGSSEPGGRPTLLRWDLGEIPPGSEIVSAEFSITVISVSRERVYEVYALARPWSESEVTWRDSAAGRPWQVAGAKGSEDHGAATLARFTPKRGALTVKLEGPGLDAVRSWVDRPVANYGLLLSATDRGGEFYAHSREAELPATRPKLTITYRSHASK